jgi:putative Holliday junction resolvase
VSPTKRILGIDYGTKRIGISVSDPLKIIARGLQVVYNTSKAISEIKRLAVEYDVDKIVVGMPFNLKGERGQKAEEVSVFIENLKAEVGIEVVEWDERFTSQDAHQTLRDMGAKKKQRQSKEKIDEIASALILQGYLDSQK